MAGMFYSLEEIAGLLGGDEEKAEDLVREHKLREFRDGGTRVVYKASEVDKILSDGPATIGPDEILDISAQQEVAEQAPAEEENFDLVDEADEEPAIELTDDSDDEPAFELADEDSDDSNEPAFELADETEDEIFELADEDKEEEVKLDVDLPAGDMSTLGLAPEETTAPSIEPDSSEDSFDLSFEDESLAPLESADSAPLISDDSELDLGNLSDLGEDVSDDSINALLATDGGDFADEITEPLDQPAASTAADIISDLTAADTRGATTGINVLGDSNDDFELSADSKAETQDIDVDDDLGDLDDDINLDSVGSGSGLLDLSLQADDTSLGAVLDDILPATEDEAPMPIGDDMDDLGGDDVPLTPAAAPMPNGAAAVAMAPAGAAVKYDVPPDASSNLLGFLLLLPMLGLIYGIIVVVNGQMDVTAGILTAVEDYLWMIFAGGAAVSLLFGIIFCFVGGGDGKPKTKKPKKVKTPKAKKEKPKKEPKPKKEKKKKAKK